MIDKNIGFIGIGNVGSKIANNLLKVGYKLFIHDIDKTQATSLINNGAVWSDSISNLISQTSIFITCLPSPSSVNEVILNALPFLNNNHLWIEMSTTDEEEIKKLSKLCLKMGTDTLEAPITGGQHRAETGNISILVSGTRKSFKRSFKLLSSIGHQILFCGEIGNATTLKVVTNYLASINLLAIGEALMVSKKYGIDLRTVFKAIKISSGNSFVNETETQLILNGSYDVGFTMDLVCKDVGLFDKLTDKFSIPADISNIMKTIFEEGKIKYGDRALSTSIVRRLEEFCKEDLRASGFPDKLVDNEIKKKGIEVKI